MLQAPALRFCASLNCMPMHSATITPDTASPCTSSPTVAQRVDIHLDDRSYAIAIGAGLLADPAT